jgi:hypothetical protein
VKPVRFLCALWCAILAIQATHATSVVAPTFAELVAEAETILRGQVTGIEARWVATPQGRVIKTFVTFVVLKRIKGTATGALTLEFLGGEIGDEGMRVEGMPRFAVGDVEILFVAGNGARVCPLIGMMHGRYRVLTDPLSARDYVARNDRVPLVSELDVHLPQAEVATSRPNQLRAALTPEIFEARIAAELNRRATLP